MSSRSRQTGLEFAPTNELHRLESAYRHDMNLGELTPTYFGTTLLDVLIEKMRRRQGVSLWHTGEW